MQESFLEQKEFLNPSLKPYNALTREEKHVLLDAALDDNLECFVGLIEDWSAVVACVCNFGSHTIYRTKPKEYKKLNVPWEVINETWKYAVMDRSGIALVYATKPEWLSEHNMWSCNHAYHSISPLKLDTAGIVAEHSLTERTEGL